MWQNNVDEEKELYRRWGCECSDGWYDIIHDCCKQIEERYAQADKKIDFEPAQIKEKWGTLRFYYGYKDASCGIAAMDFKGNVQFYLQALRKCYKSFLEKQRW